MVIIHNNQKEISVNGLVKTVEELNNMFPKSKQISDSKLSDIMQYINETGEDSCLPFMLKLPPFKKYQTILNYMREHSRIVVKYGDIVGYRDLANELKYLSGGDRTSGNKLSNIISYIRFANEN